MTTATPRKRLGFTFLLLVLSFLSLALGRPDMRARAEAAWKILVNGEPSRLVVLETPTGPVVPVYLPVPEEGKKQSYGILLETDPIGMQVKVTTVKKERSTRSPGACTKCNGSRKCYGCSGTKENYAGHPCYSCNATGLCSFCKGSGTCYLCSGSGFPNGCNLCGKSS